jgi:carbonic anhydrase
MDSRINVYEMLGIQDGDVHVIRTAGGRIQDGEFGQTAGNRIATPS